MHRTSFKYLKANVVLQIKLIGREHVSFVPGLWTEGKYYRLLDWSKEEPLVVTGGYKNFQFDHWIGFSRFNVLFCKKEEFTRAI